MQLLVREDAALAALRGGCPSPFFDVKSFPDGGFMDGRMCQALTEDVVCCLPCPLTDWVYPDGFHTVSLIAKWLTVIGTICCAFLLLSWAFLPVDKTNRHYLSISLTCAVIVMNLGFIVPLAGRPEQCFNEITPNGMATSSVCAASGTFLLFGGFAGVMWVFMRSVSLHLQICWQVVVGRNFMIFAHGTGWLVPTLAVILTMVFSGVSFRFGDTCHINHKNSLADFWIPLLIFAALTVLIQFATFGYCIKVYLMAMTDSSATTEGSSLPTTTYSSSIRTMTPRQAYRRVRRVLELQWRGIAIVLIIIADVIFFSVVFVFQDSTAQDVLTNPELARPWALCLAVEFNAGSQNRNKCLDLAEHLRVDLPTIAAVLFLLGLNGVWLLFLVGRWSMVVGWIDLARSITGRHKKEFVSVDARLDMKKDQQRSYEMLSRDSSTVVTPSSPSAVHVTKSTSVVSHARKESATPSTMSTTYASNGRKTPDYFGQTARYQAPSRSFSNPRPPTLAEQHELSRSPPRAGAYSPTYMYQARGGDYEDVNPLGMNRI